jgi:hypothetical protein
LFADDRLFQAKRESSTSLMSILQRCPGRTEEMLMVVD